MRIAGVMGLVALAGLIAPALPGQQVAAAAATHCTGPFASVTAPSPGPSDILYGTAASRPNDVWAAGLQSTASGPRNLILHNGGTGWSQVASPDRSSSGDQLTAVSASGPSDAWAVGWYDPGNSSVPFAPQTLHWDGSTWTAEPFPALPAEVDTDVHPAIVDISPTDAWLVGAYLTAGNDVSVVAHWNGSAWSLVSHPAAAITLSGVAASGPSDVWAVGVGAGPSFPTVIEHYNGSKWATSATLPGVRLGSVATVSHTQAWAVGASSSGNATATAEWNGSAWNVVPSPNPSSTDSLDAVSATPGGGVWAVGGEVDFGTGIGETQPMAMHWDGTAWTAIPATGTEPDVGGNTGTFFGVVAITDTRVVAVGLGSNEASLVADLCPFTVENHGFGPLSGAVSGPGAAAYWVIPAADTASHDLADGTGFHLFDSGAKAPGSSFGFAFPASGTYTVTDKSNGAREMIAVPMLAANVGGEGTPTLEWAAAIPPGLNRFEVEDIPPGATTFTVFYKNTSKTRQHLGTQFVAGTYEFRCRMRNLTTGAITGWSPTLTLVQP
jgi:hypothetical protein